MKEWLSIPGMTASKNSGFIKRGQIWKKDRMTTTSGEGPILRLSNWLEAILACALIGAVLLNFANVLGRYVFGVSYPGTDEIQIYVLITIAFLGFPAVAVHRMHLRMDVIVQSFGHQTRNALLFCELLLLIFLGGLVTYFSFDYVTQMKTLNVLSDNGHFPVWIPHITVTIGFTLMTLVSITQLVQLLRGKLPPNSQPENTHEEELFLSPAQLDNASKPDTPVSRGEI